MTIFQHGDKVNTLIGRGRVEGYTTDGTVIVRLADGTKATFQPVGVKIINTDTVINSKREK